MQLHSLRCKICGMYQKKQMSPLKNTRLIYLMMVLFGITILQACSSSKKYVKPDKDDVVQMINDHSFTFVAERMQPLRGRQRTLTSYYDMTVKNDTLRSFLPYFGRAFIAPIDPSKGGLEFTSTRFSYEVSPQTKDHWNITISPNDVSEVQQIIFTIYDNGNADVTINSTHRDPISFYGYLQKNE